MLIEGYMKQVKYLYIQYLSLEGQKSRVLLLHSLPGIDDLMKNSLASEQSAQVFHGYIVNVFVLLNTTIYTSSTSLYCCYKKNLCVCYSDFTSLVTSYTSLT